MWFFNYVKELASVKEEEGCQTVMIFSISSQKSFTEVNLWILWEKSNFMFSLVVWNILRQHRSRHRFIWPWLSHQLRNAGGNWNYPGILVTSQHCLFLEQAVPGSCSFPSPWVFCPSVRKGCSLATAAQHRTTRDLCFSKHGPAAGNCCHSLLSSHSSAGRNLLTYIAN